MFKSMIIDVQHMTAARWQGFPPEPVLLKKIIVQQKQTLGRNCWGSAGAI